MNIGLIAAVIMLVVWAGVTFTTDAPGWIHFLLAFGVFLLLERISARDVRK